MVSDNSIEFKRASVFGNILSKLIWLVLNKFNHFLFEILISSEFG